MRGSTLGIIFLITAMAGAESPGSRILFTQSVPTYQQEILKADLGALRGLQFSSMDGDLEKLFHLDPSGPYVDGIAQWLEQRTHFIVGENFSLDSDRLRVSQIKVRYNKPSMLPDFLLQAKDLIFARPPLATEANREANSSAGIMMSNIGGLIFGMGKAQGVVLSANLEEYGWKPATSSRFGVFKIGSLLFADRHQDTSPLVARMHRLMTLFHEARHGDGNGRTMLFPHVRCPEGHDYEGLMACDLPTNGAYMVGAQFLSSVRKACEHCTAAELEVMRVLMADHKNRALGLGGFKYDWDETPEEVKNEQQ